MIRLRADTGHLGSEKAGLPGPQMGGLDVQKREGLEDGWAGRPSD